MKKHKIISAASLYLAFLFIGHHGPFSLHQSADDHPHTHSKHIVKLLRTKDDLDQRFKVRKYVPLTS